MKSVCVVLLTLAVGLASLAAADAPAAAEPLRQETEWCIITVPASVAVGERLPVRIQIKGAAIQADTKLRVSVHWWAGRERKGALGTSAPRDVRAGQDADMTVNMPVGEREGISAVMALVYLTPAGWDERTAEASQGGVQVTR